MSESIMPEGGNVPQQEKSGSIWGKVAIAAVAGLAGMVVGAILNDSDSVDDESEEDDAIDCDEDDSGEDASEDAEEADNNTEDEQKDSDSIVDTLVSAAPAISMLAKILK